MDHEGEGSHAPEYSFSSPQAGPSSKPIGSGLKLVLPPLKGGKIVKSSKKTKRKGQDVFSPAEDKISRPVKLKPLKDVLMKLIAQIKKKDDYAFFLKPVDASKVPGYAEMIKNPMDFGTMSTKVAKGRYRTLDDFTADFKLVTNNAKLFNPPGTIYHTEAQRIETWGLEHIEKVAPSVIQHEFDWNFDPDEDDDSQQVNIDEDDDGINSNNNAGTPMDVEDGSRMGRSSSVASQLPASLTRRTLRAPTATKKSTANTLVISESLDAEGRLPGSKDGLGAFPPGSDWAETMLMLKLKGKKYRTKKERLRVEKEGPPYAADGSLDYSQMEDPFTVLSTFVPDPPSRPQLIPLYPPILSQSNAQQSAAYPTATALPLDHIGTVPLPTTLPASSSSKYKHWNVARSAQARSRLKEKDDPEDTTGDGPTWQTHRDPHTLDFGSLALLSSEIARELGKRGVQSLDNSDKLTEEKLVLDEVRNSLTPKVDTLNESLPDKQGSPSKGVSKDIYWTNERAKQAEEYIWDVVYGGVDGFAYVRSLAEFTARRDVTETPTPRASKPESDDTNLQEIGSGLGIPLADWVTRHIVDPLTDGRHSLLRQTAVHLHNIIAGADAPVVNLDTDSDGGSSQGRSLVDQVALSVHTYPLAHQALSTLQQLYANDIDMSCLIRQPSEFSQSEEEWVGKTIKEKLRQRAESVEGQAPGDLLVLEGPEILNQAFNYSAELIVQMDQDIREGKPPSAYHPQAPGGDVTENNDGEGMDVDAEVDFVKEDSPSGASSTPMDQPEDPALRILRLNLLALTKRAPVNTIAPLPKDLVPKDVQDVVPTLSS